MKLVPPPLWYGSTASKSWSGEREKSFVMMLEMVWSKRITLYASRRAGVACWPVVTAVWRADQKLCKAEYTAPSRLLDCRTILLVAGAFARGLRSVAPIEPDLPNWSVNNNSPGTLKFTNLSITKILQYQIAVKLSAPLTYLNTYTWKACCIIMGFLQEKWCPSLDTYPKPVGGLFGLLRGWNIGRVQ